MNKKISWILCVLSFLSVVYFFIIIFWINDKSFSDIPGWEYGYITFFIAIFLITLISILKKQNLETHFKSKRWKQEKILVNVKEFLFKKLTLFALPS